MDWLSGMNHVVDHIEEHLTDSISLEELSRIVGCSVYEFSRIFSFMTGISVSEYIRRRRLSQAAFELQNNKDKVIDVALQYGYESQATFTRAFKEMHGVTPSTVRKTGASIKVYPPLTFKLSIRGMDVMKFRVEEKSSFQIVGLSGYDDMEPVSGDTLTPLWREFMDHYNPVLWSGGDENCYYQAPFWQVGAYQFSSEGGRMKAVIGAEYKGKQPEGMTIEMVPAATWAVFSFTSPTGKDYVPAAYTRILTEWFPTSPYKRDEEIPNLEVFPSGDPNGAGYTWEIWMPIKEKE